MPHRDLTFSAEERRVLTLLQTPLSLGQIAQILERSRPDIQQQALELYRRLDVYGGA